MATKATKSDAHALCELPRMPERALPVGLAPGRESLIRYIEKKWVNGTMLRYCFLRDPVQWRGGQAQEDAVSAAFQTWKDLGLGLTFTQVQDPEEAEVRIGFEPGGSWSYVGRDVLLVSDITQRTMNFGWDLTTSYGRDTALHEIGHTLGFPHEHQNPNAGIVWDQAAVISEFSGPPNNWTEDKITWNILRKIPAQQVDGSSWDPNSVMHYRFPAGVIRQPSRYQNEPLIPAPGLSEVDIAEVKKFYPALQPTVQIPELRPFESQPIDLTAGQQLNFTISPTLSRDFVIQTFGAADTVMVLFERISGQQRFLAGDDDSGTALNAKIEQRLFRGGDYVLRLRLYSAVAVGQSAVMLW